MRKVIYPLSWLAGREDDAADVLQSLAMEMLGHRSDLLELANRAKDPAERAHLEARAGDLEKYAAALEVVYLQLRPERWTPETMGGLLDLAEKHEIALPEWMRPSEQENAG